MNFRNILISWNTERGKNRNCTQTGTINDCTHRGFKRFTDSYVENLIAVGEFVFCPKCGEKL